MEEARTSGAKGPGALSERSASPAPTTKREVDALAKRLVKTDNPDLLEALQGLTPILKAYLATTEEWAILVKALQVDVVRGVARLTQSQKRGIDMFKKEAKAFKGEKEKKQDESYDVEPGGADE